MTTPPENPWMKGAQYLAAFAPYPVLKAMRDSPGLPEDRVHAINLAIEIQEKVWEVIPVKVQVASIKACMELEDVQAERFVREWGPLREALIEAARDMESTRTERGREAAPELGRRTPRSRPRQGQRLEGLPGKRDGGLGREL